MEKLTNAPLGRQNPNRPHRRSRRMTTRQFTLTLAAGLASTWVYYRSSGDPILTAMAGPAAYAWLARRVRD